VQIKHAAKIIMFSKKLTNKYKEKYFTVNRGHIIKSKETRVVAYTCRYFSGQLFPLFKSVAVAELGFKGPLEYLQV